jgi:flagellar hook-associated protein 1 FlgK
MAGLMDIGKSGLQSYREALSVTGQNIANINTDGYKRREASLAEVTGSSGGINSLPSQAGLGVRIDGIRRSFDEFLLNKARNATSFAANQDSYLSAITQLEDILLPGDANIGATIGRFMESLQDVAVNPSDVAPRIVALQAGETLANLFHQTAGLIDELKAGVFTQSNQAISEINILSNSLANINRNLASSAGKSQNALLDNRDSIIDRISQYVEVTVSLQNSGAATIRLGNTGNGPALVSGEKASTISAKTVDENLQFFLSDGGEFRRTSQITNGSLRGYADAFNSASNVMTRVDQLAKKFIEDINSIHVKGLDLDGQPGVDMFHGVAYTASASLNNLGTGAAVVNVTDPKSVSSSSIKFTFDGDASIWRALDQYGMTLASGRNQINLPGLEVEFSGDPASGDEFILQPSKGAARNLTFALTRAEQIAAASGFLVSNDTDNKSDAQVKITITDETPNASDLPLIQNVLANNHGSANSSQFIRDGAVAIIPANTDNIDLISLTEQSSVKFSAAEAVVPSISSISITIDDGLNAQKAYTFDLAQYADDLNSDTSLAEDDKFNWKNLSQIADLINVGALKATNAFDVDNNNNPIEFRLADLGGFASAAGGNLSISLNENQITSGEISVENYPTITGTTKAGNDRASDIQIFTRDGRHIAGSQFVGIENLITKDNGFFEEAVYFDDYLNQSGENGYLGVSLENITDISSSLIKVQDTQTGHTISFDRINDIDNNESSLDGTRSSSGVFKYELTVDNISVSLNEANVEGNTPEAIAKAALREIRSGAPSASLSGVSSIIETEAFVISNDQKTTLDSTGRLTVTYGGVDYYLSYESNSYSISGGRGDQLSLSFNSANNTVSQTYPSFPDDDTSVVIKFEDQEYTISMTNGQIAVSGGEEGRLNVSYDSNYILNISSNGGSVSASEIEIVADSVISNNSLAALEFGLISANSTPTTSYSFGGNSYNPTTISNVYTPPNYNFSIEGGTLRVEKHEDHLDSEITITASANSKAGSRIRITGLPAEELIVILSGSDDGNGARARNLSAVYDQHPGNILAPKRDVSIKVTDTVNGTVEFIDTATGTSLATRQINEEQRVSARGYGAEFNGVLMDDDTFHITSTNDGVHDNRNLLELLDLQYSQTDDGGFQRIFSGLVAEVGAEIEAGRLNSEAANALKDASLEAEAMYSGVNLDTEASKLIEFQQAYQASARILQTARELFDTLIRTI